MTTPLILFSDHPASFSGLGRITRDLATRIHTHLNDHFRVCSLGYGSSGSIQLPFPQYNWQSNDYFLPLELPFIAKDFCSNQPFILFTIGDIQRYLQVADPSFCIDRPFAEWWRNQRQSGSQLWGYFPIDAHGIGGKLPPQLAHTLTHYDRILVPSEWAAGIVRRTLPGIEVTAIPHGIDTNIFHPHPKDESRDRIGEILSDYAQWPKQPIDIPDDALWIGIVATNQPRKDWGLGVEVVAELAKTRPVFLWSHIDRLKRDQGWSLLELLSDFGLLQSSLVTMGNVPDESMAIAYSAMGLTLGIGRGEGFGYPIFESIFCGAPCIASSYGAHAEYNHPADRIDPFRLRIEGPLNLLRPVHRPEAWVSAAKKAVDDPEPWWDKTIELEWDRVWPRFSEWLKAGL